MSYHGDISLEDTIDIKFTTRRFSTGAPFTLAGTPAVAAYVGNSTTEITAGITLTVDFDARTGLNNVRVVATAANGYTAATNVQLVITAGTVDSVSVVGEVVGSFSIAARSSLRPTVAGRTLDVSAGGEAGVDWANVGSQTTTVGLSGTTVKTATDVETDTADIQTTIGTPAGASVSADVAAVKVDTAAILVDTGTTLDGKIDTIGGIVDAILVDTAEIGAAGAGLTTLATAASIAALNNISAAQVATEIADALATDTYAESAAVPAATAALATKISWLTTLARNKITQTATAQVVRNDADNATIATSTLSDDGTTLVRGEFA